MKYFKFILVLILLILNLSCGEGIAPEPIVQTGFSGTISFVGNWPQGITRTHIVVFKDPLLSAGDFNALNLKFVSVEIPYGSQVFYFNSADTAVVKISEGEFSYVAVAQQKIPNVSLLRKDWVVVGVYYAGGDTTKPGKLVIPQNTLVKNINIICDFNNPPPQPPGG
ncbi:MAG: hypothetical protein A2455_07625 [Ignavibacteria bacterium RIFOXYC2_FULL_35_16]|nr:MAG: hypothetical protein A2058_11680 [Ignavibacteria bacterium GWA2_36_19]OGU54999.1 MAG: hypothetical protein A2006_01530 [Ignavibacteria bacterium GWC2_35_8]OGU56367.1 MAG: hypothetical protein A2X60_03130 [Ignavibacteria bacterium GWF2_35_20]OGU78960.1 MAG: hypothetical protein A2W11_06405 [Ignavibacteria bacterium RBG_16_35_7]OGU87639.1 MAG: hypothetical protein A3K31_12590 [Ignavibacteria bacterium RIFOXYA12_FULL_35_25]OGU92287.1 MAG: hypothetical protein A2492_02135 [Ignavibacteria b